MNSYANLNYDMLFIIQHVYISVCAVVGCISHNGSSVRAHESFEIEILNTIRYVFLTCDEYKIKEVLSKFPAFYGTRRFIAAFTTARHHSLS